MAEISPVLTIVVPALDEEAVIGDTLRRCLEARSHIFGETSVASVEIVAVSDGSTDRTEEIARSFEDVSVLAFERNRGYGAAIKCGFAHGSGELVGFLDADGTCDPRFFATLVQALEEEQADLALGSRLSRDSEMPWVRALGNILFAWLLGFLSERRVADTSSGMRVIRRSALPHLYPLPDGLQFTPAMSARVLLEGRLRLVERPMPYAERVGRSKLSVWRDGVRFLSCIVQAAVAFRPARPLLAVASVLGLAAVVTGLPTVVLWLRQGWFPEWMVYRVLLASLLFMTVAILACGAIVADRIAATAHGRPPTASGATGLIARLFAPRVWLWLGLALLGAALAISWPGIVEYVATGHVQMHWSRSVLSSLLVVTMAVVGVTTFLLNMMTLIQVQRAAVPPARLPDRVHAARRADIG